MNKVGVTLNQLQDAHKGLLLLRSSISAAPRQHLLRNCITHKTADLLAALSRATESTLVGLSIIELSAAQLSWASLPNAKYGLALRRAADLTAPSLASSMCLLRDKWRRLVHPEALASFKAQMLPAIELSKQGSHEGLGRAGDQQAWSASVIHLEEPVGGSTG